MSVLLRHHTFLSSHPLFWAVWDVPAVSCTENLHYFIIINIFWGWVGRPEHGWVTYKFQGKDLKIFSLVCFWPPSLVFCSRQSAATSMLFITICLNHFIATIRSVEVNEFCSRVKALKDFKNVCFFLTLSFLFPLFVEKRRVNDITSLIQREYSMKSVVKFVYLKKTFIWILFRLFFFIILTFGLRQ